MTTAGVKLTNALIVLGAHALTLCGGMSEMYWSSVRAIASTVVQCALQKMDQLKKDAGSDHRQRLIEPVASYPSAADNANGLLEILGTDVFTTEDGAAWLAFLRGLVARGLSGVKLVISDFHKGLRKAIASVFPGAGWQHCRTHFMRNLLTRVRKNSQSMVATLVRSIFMLPDADTVRQQTARVVEQLEATGFREAATMLANAQEEILAFTAFPKEFWKQIWSNNPQERLNKEIRRRTDVVGIFPNREALLRLVGALLAEQHDEWQVVRRYMGVEGLAKMNINGVDGDNLLLDEAHTVRQDAQSN